MKKIIIGAAILLMPLSVNSARLQITIDNNEPSLERCFVSCPEFPNGPPSIPKEYDCNNLPGITEDCTLIIKTISKKSLENAIINLQTLTGIRKGD